MPVLPNTPRQRQAYADAGELVKVFWAATYEGGDLGAVTKQADAIVAGERTRETVMALAAIASTATDLSLGENAEKVGLPRIAGLALVLDDIERLALGTLDEEG